MSSSEPMWITGVGAVSPGGWSAKDTWELVVGGGSAIHELERFELHGASTRVCGTVPGLEHEVPDDESLALEFATAAAGEALTAAGAGPGDVDLAVVANHGERRLPVTGEPSLIITAAGLADELASLSGAPASVALYGACAGGSLAIGAALDALRAGEAGSVLVGGADCLLREFDFFQFCNLYAMSVRDCPPEQACCPFDSRRDGFVLSEGAAFLVIETEEHARARGSVPLAALEGFGSAQNAYHIVASPPDARGPADAIRNAIRDAGLSPEDIDYVNAHGTSTRDNDWCETLAIRAAFGEAAHDLPVSSSKSQLGHTMAAAGALEAVLCVFALREALAPPTINLQEPDEQCDLDYVPLRARPQEMHHVVSNSFGFGGHSSSLVLGTVP